MFCEACGHWFEVDRLCKSRTCPVCGMVWANAQAAIMSWRFVEVGRHPDARGAWGREIIISPPRKTWPRLLEDDKYVKYKRTEVYDIATRIGVRGGTAVFHPYRDSEEQGQYDVDGPHYHVLGWCDKLKSMDDPSMKRLKAEGWVWWHVVNRRGRPLRLKEWAQWYRKCHYELSHCGIIDGMHAFTWFGICNPKVVPLGQEERSIRRIVKGCPCPKCGSLYTVPVELAKPDLDPADRPHYGYASQKLLKVGGRWHVHRHP